MTLSTKILIAISAIVAICLSAIIIYKQIEISDRQKAIETEVVKQKDLAGNITRSMNEYATKKDIESYIQNSNLNLKAIQDDMKLLSAEISAVNDYTIDSIGYHKTNISSTHTGETNPDPKIPTVECNGQQIPCPNTDSFGYLTDQQMLKLYEPFVNVNVPIGEVGFSAWQQKPWEVKILPRTYHMTSVVGTDENQRQYFYNKVSVNVDGKSYDVKISTATTKQEYPEASFNWWNPRLFFTVGDSINISQLKNSNNIGLLFSSISYGKFKLNPVFSLMQIGISYETNTSKPAIIVNPINYNLANSISSNFIQNTYVGPSIQIDFNSNFYFGGNISIGF